MTPLTLRDLLGPYAAVPWSPAELASGEHLVRAWNALAPIAEADGVPLLVNPATGNYIAGTGNGGARPKGSKVGAPGSKHQLLLALDWYDPQRTFMTWLLSYGLEAAGSLGLYFEHPQWTRSWVHGQIVPPGNGLSRWNIFFVPYADLESNPPVCGALLVQAAANVPQFEFKAAAGRSSACHMGKGIDMARAAGAGLHADVLDNFKDQLLIVLLKRLKDKYCDDLVFPVAEVDDTGQDMLAFQILDRNFIFKVEKKQ